ncbi:unnamed protein product [Diamesa tonsa]
MDYCTAKTLLKDAPKNRNIFNELFYGGTVVGYMEKHNIYEIITEVLIRVGIDQPNNDYVAEYLARKITEIAETFTRNKIHLDLQATPENASLFIRDFAETFKIPILQWNGLNEDPIKREHDINKFLKERQFDKKNLIFCDFEMKNGKDSILRITRNKSQVFLNRIHKFIGNLKPERVAKQNWPLRCLIIGRIGSGRDIQGALMAQEFGLVLIVLDYLLIQYHKKPSLAAKNNIGFLGFLQERLLKPDCISNGWVIVSNPWKLDHLQVLMEHFILKPNHVFFIHTSEQRSRNTIIKNSNLSHLFYFDKQDQGNFINYQMNLYNCHKKEFDKYFIKNKQKIFHIDGNNSVNSIKNLIWAELAKC